MAHSITLQTRANEPFIYSGQTIFITDRADAVADGVTGLWMESTRLLSRHLLSVHDMPLVPFAASATNSTRSLAYAEVPSGPGVPLQSVSVRIARAVSEGLREELHIENFACRVDATRRETARFELAVQLAADFADLEEFDAGLQRTSQRADDRDARRPGVETTWDTARGELRFRWQEAWLDRAVAVRVVACPTPPRWEGGALVFPLVLPPRGHAMIALSIEPIFAGVRRPAPVSVFGVDDTPLARTRETLRAGMARLTTMSPTVARAWQTAVDDLASLPLGLDPGPAAPSAGLPLYQQFFGRDTLTIGWQALLATPHLLHDALLLNAAWQGTVRDDWRDEEPGKLIHQARRGPHSLLGGDPLDRYYGDLSAPQDFLAMLGQYVAWTNDRATARTLLPAARRILAWLDTAADLDGDGFLEYMTRSSKGVRNQGWKDSDDAIVDERGALVSPPLATSEMQGVLVHRAATGRPPFVAARRATRSGAAAAASA